MENGKWKTVRLGDVCEKGSSNIAQNEITDNNGEYPIYGAAGFIKNVDFYKQDKPYIGIVKDGAGVGRVSVHPAKSSLIGTMQYIFPKENIDIKFLAEFLKYQNLSRFYTGATIPHIYFKDYQNIPLKLPSLQKQKHISAVLDKCTALIAKHKLMLEKYDTLIKSRFIEMFGDPASNPMGWEVKKLGEIAEYWNGLTYKPENVQENGIIVLRSSNIQNSALDFGDTVRVNCKIKDKQFVKQNDILMCSRNGSARLVGKVALISELSEPMSFGAFMMIIRSQYYSYLFTYFQTEAFRRQIRTGATTTVNQITNNMLNIITLPLPPLELQQQFAAFVQQIDKSKFENAIMEVAA